MSDDDTKKFEIPTRMEFENLFPQVYSEKFFDYLNLKLSNIAFLSLWDECFLMARFMIYNGSVPDGIKGINQKALNKFCELNLASEEITLNDLLSIAKPIQQGLSDLIVRSIDNNEIMPEITTRTIEGKINPRLTFCRPVDIINWLDVREIKNFPVFKKNYEPSKTRMWELMDQLLKTATYLSGSVNDPNYESPYFNQSEKDSKEYLYENTKLKMEVKNLNTQIENLQNTVHGNESKNTKKREEVFGAAIAVMSVWPDECTTKSKKFIASKIAAKIEKEAILFWEDGKPPILKDGIATHIRDWLKKAGAKRRET